MDLIRENVKLNETHNFETTGLEGCYVWFSVRTMPSPQAYHCAIHPLLGLKHESWLERYHVYEKTWKIRENIKHENTGNNLPGNNDDEWKQFWLSKCERGNASFLGHINLDFSKFRKDCYFRLKSEWTKAQKCYTPRSKPHVGVLLWHSQVCLSPTPGFFSMSPFSAVVFPPLELHTLWWNNSRLSSRIPGWTQYSTKFSNPDPQTRRFFFYN